MRRVIKDIKKRGEQRSHFGTKGVILMSGGIIKGTVIILVFFNFAGGLVA